MAVYIEIDINCIIRSFVCFDKITKSGKILALYKHKQSVLTPYVTKTKTIQALLPQEIILSLHALQGDGEYCDDTTVFASGTCARYNPTYTNCDCDGTTKCQKDPNNGNVYIPCEGANLDVTGTAFYCESDRIQLDTCTCFEGTLGAKISDLRINSVKLATSERDPVDTCTTQAQSICLNCQTVALCEEDDDNPGTFTTRNTTQSPCSPTDGLFCDDTTVFASGTCARYNPTYTNCDCDGTTKCQKDPNNGNVYIPCEGANLDVTGTAFHCESDRIQLDTCTCFEGTLGAKISELRINSGKLATPKIE
ncbi:hypothetical protein Anas_12939 [Armadillidium nasatum]|uniref:Uncharacterized protein n=1 Tax=Armadillidium nasatum TaxID=96803 RepID=A0A5N5SKF2_9CRUS|nr:hypothetical protein Anas_12939 [Armadillidium nasatum]